MNEPYRKITMRMIPLALVVLAGFALNKQFFAWASPPAQPEHLAESANVQNTAVTQGSAALQETADRQGISVIPQELVTAPHGNSIPVADFSTETIGAQPRSFSAVVGNWIIGVDQENTVLVVDGREWSRGKPAAGLADQARALYGERYAEFLDNVSAFAYYPFAVSRQVENFENGQISVRFMGIAGRIDQGAGILFDLKPNGDYYALRANPLENNLVLWRFKHGKRSSIAWVRDVETPSHVWHDLKLVVDGNLIKGYVNGKQFIAHRLPEVVYGKVGLWTKADSVVYFDDYRVDVAGGG